MRYKIIITLLSGVSLAIAIGLLSQNEIASLLIAIGIGAMCGSFVANIVEDGK